MKSEIMLRVLVSRICMAMARERHTIRNGKGRYGDHIIESGKL